MSDLTITGVVSQILNPETGVSKAGKEWSKQEFIIETESGKYKSKVCFQLFGDKADLLSKISEGQTVDVSFNLESREHNGRWFHGVNAWKIIITDEAVNEHPQKKADEYESGLPESELGRKIGEDEGLPTDDIPF